MFSLIKGVFLHKSSMLKQINLSEIDITEVPFKAPSFIMRCTKRLMNFVWRNTAFIRTWLKPYYLKLKPHLRTRYAYAVYFFLVWATFIDQYTIIQRISLYFKLNKLEKKIELKKAEVELNRKQIYELKTNATTLEKFAREHYLMHRPGEVVFVVEK